jgi:23S rRNA (cytidine2498-2'-O)-methyltransferase
MKFPASPFLLISCQPGAEAALKREIAREHPDLTLAFSRPGFLTVKSRSGPLSVDAPLRSVFARAWALSQGKLTGTTPEEWVPQILEKAHAWGEGKPLRLHVFEREEHLPGEEPPGADPGARARRLEELLVGQPGLLAGEVAREGEGVLTVVCVEPDQAWIGTHLHGGDHSPFPGGRPRIALPAESPSRAYLKLEEGLAFSRAPLRAGDCAVEVGSSPGGASLALLRRQLTVVGIDPAAMDPAVASLPGFRHVPLGVAAVQRRDLPPVVQWILVDINAPPGVALQALEKLLPWTAESLLGCLLTLKLNHWRMADDIPSYLERIRALGLSRVRATQLPSNRQEIFVSALSRKGLLRAGRAPEAAPPG